MGGELAGNREAASETSEREESVGASASLSVVDSKERTEELGGISSSEPIQLARGALLADRYQIEAVLGEGGCGQVFRAWDRVLGESVALKILRPDRARERSWVKRLAREVKVARAIRHPNVCQVFELGHAGGHWFLTMELGTDAGLRALLTARAGKPLVPLADRLADARAITDGLAAIHASGIVHRDVTPQNVLRMPDGRLVLSDFGLAVEITATTTMHGGTPSYMPPETSMGARADQRSDVWQLGAILHEVLFGRRPAWEQTSGGLRLRRPIAPRGGAVEEALEGVVRACLDPNPAARPASAGVVAERLAEAEQARPRSLLGRAVHAIGVSLSWRGALVGGVAAVVLAGDLVLAASAWRRGEAIDHLHRALADAGGARASAGQLARDLNGLATALEASGRGDEALAYVDRATADLADELGPAHPLVGTFVANRGEILAALGRFDEARVAFERAITLDAPAYGAGSASLAFPLAGLGQVLLEEGRAREAIGPLERALAIRRAREPDRARVADTAFALARALRDGGGDWVRARQLAIGARDLDRSLGRWPSLDVVEAWLAEPRLPPR